MNEWPEYKALSTACLKIVQKQSQKISTRDASVVLKHTQAKKERGPQVKKKDVMIAESVYSAKHQTFSEKKWWLICG